MRILFILNNKEIHEANFNNLKKFKIAKIELSNRTNVSIGDNDIITFNVKGNNDNNIFDLTPVQYRDINNFLNEFKPDIIHSLDEGILGLVVQNWAISNNIPYILSLSDNEINNDYSRILKIIKPLGFNERFVNSFYNNCFSIIINSDQNDNEDTQNIYNKQKEFINKIKYNKEVIENKSILLNDMDYLNIISNNNKSNKIKLFSKKSKNIIWLILAIIGSTATIIGLKINNKNNGKQK